MVRSRILTLAHDLPYLANAESIPASAKLAAARRGLQQIEVSADLGQQPFTRITSEELATGNFELTYLSTAS